MQKVKVEKVHETYREEVCYNPHPNTPPMHAPFCFGIRTFFHNWSRGKPYENNKQREWERKKGERKRATLQKLEMPVFELRFFKFPRFGKFLWKVSEQQYGLPPRNFFYCVAAYYSTLSPTSFTLSLFLEQALLIPYSSSLCVFRFPVKTLRRQ